MRGTAGEGRGGGGGGDRPWRVWRDLDAACASTHPSWVTGGAVGWAPVVDRVTVRGGPSRLVVRWVAVRCGHEIASRAWWWRVTWQPPKRCELGLGRRDGSRLHAGASSGRIRGDVQNDQARQHKGVAAALRRCGRRHCGRAGFAGSGEAASTPKSGAGGALTSMQVAARGQTALGRTSSSTTGLTQP